MLERLGFGLAVTVICMSIVFLVLVGLMYVIKIQRAIVEKIEGTGKKEPVREVSQPVAEVEEEEDEELIAVIAAAAAAALGRPVSQIVVRSINRLEPLTPSWVAAGRQDQIHSRF